MKAGAALSAVLCLIGGGAVAQPADSTADRLAGLEVAYGECTHKAVTNPDYGVCGAARLKDGDTLLNEVWKRVYGDASGEVKRALLAEQRLWIAYKDRSCQFWLDGQGREGQVIHFPRCRAAVIEDRIGLLDDMDFGG